MSFKNQKESTIVSDNSQLKDKQNQNRNINFHINNNYNSGRNKKSFNQLFLKYLKKSSSQKSINDSYLNKSRFNIQNFLNKSELITKRKYSPNSFYKKYSNTQRNIKLKLNNKQCLKKMLLNPSVFNDKNKRKINSLSKNSSINNSKNNLSVFNSKKKYLLYQ